MQNQDCLTTPPAWLSRPPALLALGSQKTDCDKALHSPEQGASPRQPEWLRKLHRARPHRRLETALESLLAARETQPQLATARESQLQLAAGENSLSQAASSQRSAMPPGCLHFFAARDVTCPHNSGWWQQPPPPKICRHGTIQVPRSWPAGGNEGSRVAQSPALRGTRGGWGPRRPGHCCLQEAP